MDAKSRATIRGIYLDMLRSNKRVFASSIMMPTYLRCSMPKTRVHALTQVCDGTVIKFLRYVSMSLVVLCFQLHPRGLFLNFLGFLLNTAITTVLSIPFLEIFLLPFRL